MGINKKMYELGSKRSIIREIFEYSKRRGAEIGRENVFDFSLGNPSVPAPEIINSTLSRLLAEEDSVALHGYTSAQGDAKCRGVISDSINRRFGVNISPEHIYMTCGAAASLTISLSALTERGQDEEVIVFAPFFTEYRVFAEAAGAHLVICPPKDGTLDIDIDALKSLITPKTKALILNSPNNPSGVAYPESTVKALCELLKSRENEYNHPIYLIADEPYRELVFDGKAVPYLMNYYPDTLVCYSYSKALSLPGERIGYIAVCPEMHNASEVYLAVCGAGRSLGYVCAPSLMQRLIAECEDVHVDVNIYRENRDLLYNNLTKWGFECVYPSGAFYLFLKTPTPNAYEFFERAKAHELLVVPCDDFGTSGYVRIAYCVDKNTILGALDKFHALAKEYGLNSK